MNKLFIILLAVCLISVHGFVAQEAETATHNYLDDIQKQFQEFSSNINGLIDPEQIKKDFTDIVDKLNGVVTDIKAKVNEGAKKD